MKLFIAPISASKLQRTRLRLEDLDTLASVDFEIPALVPVLAVHTGIIRITAGAVEAEDSWKHQCDDRNGQNLHGCSTILEYAIVG
jgi:hypothetical protein